MLDLLIRNIKWTVTIFILIISVVMLSATIIFVEKKYDVYYNIGLSVSTSVLATSIVQIIQLFTEQIEKFTNQRMFLTLFGCDEKINGNSIAIVVPAYELKPENLQISANTFKQKAQKLVSKSSINAAINNDVTAASYLVSAFSKLGLPVPQIKWDTEININDDSVKTYILIGLSNAVIQEKLDTNSTDKYFLIGSEDNSNGYLSKVIIKTGLFDNNNNLIDKRNWTGFTVTVDPQTAQSRSTANYALFAKCSINNRLFIVCGGATELSTFQIGTYISDSGWRRIYNELKQEKNTDITPRDAYAVVFQLSSTSISFERKCIKRK